MRNDVTFQQRCPVCGRAVQVSVVLLGRRVYCQHCGGGFTAMDETMRLRSAGDATTSLDVVDRLLARASLTLERSSPTDASEWQRSDEASVG
jgi:hypothetical protein